MSSMPQDPGPRDTMSGSLPRDLYGTSSSPANVTFSVSSPCSPAAPHSPNHASCSRLALYFIHWSSGSVWRKARTWLSLVTYTLSLSVDRLWLNDWHEHRFTSLGHQAGSLEPLPFGNVLDVTWYLQTRNPAIQPLPSTCSRPGEAVGGEGLCL